MGDPMYPDIITPRSHPDVLQDPSYDPLHLMPEEIPAHPRVLLSGEQLARARASVRSADWARISLARLKGNCKVEDVPTELPVPADTALNGKVAGLAERNALAFLLTDEPAFRDRALALFRSLARVYPRLPLNGDIRAAGGGLSESRFNLVIGRVYDLLAAGGLDEADDILFCHMLRLSIAASKGSGHWTCGNHNTWALTGRVTVAAALGDRAGLHDALYGCQCPKAWRYGLIHQLRHDILSDGQHWERSPGYHLYTLMGLTDAADVLANTGVDIWHAELPTLKQDDAQDKHRAYGPAGAKCMKAAFDAPLYMMFGNGDFSQLGDSGVANIRGVWIWGILYNKAYDAYGDPKYAWLLNRIEEEHPEREHAGLPMPLQTDKGDVNFARIGRVNYPAGEFSLARDTDISLSGRVRNGCTLFPVHGSAVLRGRPDEPTGPGAYIFYGPHSAGHQSPGALHIDVDAGGEILTDAPHADGYEDPHYVTWVRTTVAHNTVTVDEKSMFPYDGDGDAIWETDRWRDNISDGELMTFDPGPEVKVARARNVNVYPGVTLDRTLVLQGDMLLDVFRVVSDGEHQYDWCMHCMGTVEQPGPGEPDDLGQARGYRHMVDAVRLKAEEGAEFGVGRGSVRLYVPVPAGGELLMARHELSVGDHGLGARDDEPKERTAIIARVRANSAVLVALWSFRSGGPCAARHVGGGADEDLVVDVAQDAALARWCLPVGTDSRPTCWAHPPNP